VVGSVPEPAGWEDQLTGLEGPDFWQRMLVAEIARSARYKRRMTVVVIEVDGIADLQDSWGADVARHALREAAQCVRRSARTSDFCTRIDTTRFGVVLTETDEVAAINFIERVRENGPPSMPRGADRLRFAFGWASPKAGESAGEVVKRADHRLLIDILT